MMCAKRGWYLQSRDAAGIVILAGIIILVRSLFAPAPVVLPAPSNPIPDQTALDRDSGTWHVLEPERRQQRDARAETRQKPDVVAAEKQLFTFDPNNLDSLGFRRLGFSAAQTRSLLKYRASGAVFRKPEDFARSFVVSKEMYEQLKPFIIINLPEDRPSATSQTLPEPLRSEPLQRAQPQRETVEINRADTAQLKKLRGIGGYYAQKMVQYRERLGGFAVIEQLLEIDGIDEERLALFGAQVEIDYKLIRKIDLVHADVQALGKHPYIGPYAARWIVHYREQLGDTVCTPQALVRRNILKPRQAELLKYYLD